MASTNLLVVLIAHWSFIKYVLVPPVLLAALKILFDVHATIEDLLVQRLNSHSQCHKTFHGP